jgi:hypothetical protein
MSWQASARVEGPDPDREMAFAGQLEARRPDGTPPRISTGEIEAMEARPFLMTVSTPKGSAERLEYERGSKDGGANPVLSP